MLRAAQLALHSLSPRPEFAPGRPERPAGEQQEAKRDVEVAKFAINNSELIILPFQLMKRGKLFAAVHHHQIRDRMPAFVRLDGRFNQRGGCACVRLVCGPHHLVLSFAQIFHSIEINQR